MHRTISSAKRVALGAFAAALFVAAAGAQVPTPTPTPSPLPQPVLGAANESNHFIETPKGWTHPKTAWGDPDLEGVWPIPGGINLERSCPRAGGPGRGGAPAAGAPAGPAATAAPCDPNNPPAFLTEAQFKAREEAAAAAEKAGDASDQAIAAGNFGAALLRGVTDPTSPYRQTSTIMDPPNGRLPALTEEGKRLSAQMRSSWSAFNGEVQTWDHWLDFDSWDRCITRGMPTSMMAYRYNNGIKIFQAPGMVVLSLEMIHEDRIIYTDGRPPLKPVHSHYLGEPRGRWEGNTLVVVTTNYKPGPSGTNLGVYGSPGGSRWPVSPQMKTTERFTRLNNDYLLYEMTVEDPVIMTRPYTVRFPIKQDPTYEWWEYACHEGNRTIRDYINTSRAERAARGTAGVVQEPAGAPAGRGGPPPAPRDVNTTP
jgi:hypothetical protein